METEIQEPLETYQCSYFGCTAYFTEADYTCFSTAKEKDKFQEILEALMRSKLFCMKCCSKHATLLCLNQKILVEQ